MLLPIYYRCRTARASHSIVRVLYYDIIGRTGSIYDWGVKAKCSVWLSRLSTELTKLSLSIRHCLAIRVVSMRQSTRCVLYVVHRVFDNDCYDNIDTFVLIVVLISLVYLYF